MNKQHTLDLFHKLLCVLSFFLLFFACERCGKENDSVSTVINPYILAMSDEKVEITVCDVCYSDLVMSI